MTIGLDASRANRKFRGGTEWYSFHLIKELAKLDSANQYVLYCDRPLTEELAGAISGHANFKVKILNWLLPNFWTQMRLSWEMLFHPPDRLFVPAHTLPVIHPKKSVVTIHDIGFERERELYSSDQIGPAGGLKGKTIDTAAKLLTRGKFSSNILGYHSWSARYALKNAKKIIAVSEFTKREMLEVYGAEQAKISVIHNGFDNYNYQPIADRRRISQVLGKYGVSAPYIFYVGRLEKKKNTARLIHAFSLMRERNKSLKHRLVLVGNAGLGFDEVKYMIEEFDLNNEVIITGWVPEEDLPYLYNGASLFVFPSLYEGFGIPLLEAMACGAPIVASNIPALTEVAGDAAMFFNPHDNNDMAEKMARVLLDKNLAAGLIARGRERTKNFSLKKCARETLALLEKL
ncbi:MAG: glycosyltransferase family 1 protein [bacterium]|nr:glycosyltransferase family 1 protein [bacterium]